VTLVAASRLGRRGVGPWTALSLLAAALVLAPVAGLVLFAARGSGDLWPHLVRFVLPEALRVTAILLAGVGALVIVVGVGTAVLVTRFAFPGRRLLEWALLLPLAVPTYILAYAWLDVMHPVGPVQTWLRTLLGAASPRDFALPDIRSMGGCILLLGFVLYPYVYLAVRAVLLMQPAAVGEAARVLGAGRARAFLRVELPLARPAVAVGTSLALMEALNDIGASQFLGVRTLTVAVYTTWVNRSSIGGAAQIALVMLAAVIGLVLLERWARRHQRQAWLGQHHRPPAAIPLSGLTAVAAALACAFPVLIGFGIPAAYLAAAAAHRVTAFGLPRDLGAWILASVGVSAAATAATVVLGLALAYTARLAGRHVTRAAVRVAGIGYAIPGTVLAVGLLVPLATFDNALDTVMRSTFGLATGLVLTGSGAALVIAYVIRFLTISSGAIEAGLAKVGPNLDMAASILGAGPTRTVLAVHLPILRPMLAAAALLVFVDCLKELPATLLLRPFNFETLATFVYGEAIRGTYENGAVAALMIVVAGLVPIVLLSRTALGAGTAGADRRR
jgi:iron(III) transport system permease protein